MIRFNATLAILFVCLGGCVTAKPIPFPRELIDQGPINSAVELQALQTRTFDADKVALLSAIVTVLQNEGHQINQTDFDIGTINATTREDTRSVRLSSDFLATAFGDSKDSPFFKLVVPSEYVVTLTSQRVISILVTEFSPTKSKVRLSMTVRAKLPGKVVLPHEDIDTNPDRYQELFSKIQQALFLKRNLE